MEFTIFMHNFLPDNNLEFDQKSAKFPYWLKRPIAHSGKHKSIEQIIHSSGLHTVCVEAKCPNRSECYSKGTATFLIMGNTCTRHCSFCSVNHGVPESIDPAEPQKVLDAIKTLKLRHVVITSVTRDDLYDGGASVYTEIITLVRQALPEITIEILIPDLKGNLQALERIISVKPDIFNHNIETVPRLYPLIRPQALYQRSLYVLEMAAKGGLNVKSGLMVGLGETVTEVLQVMKDMYAIGCRIITIGQYLQPSDYQTQVKEFITPDQFSSYEKIGYEIGFSSVFAGPFIRSSYMAEKIFKEILR